MKPRLNIWYLSIILIAGNCSWRQPSSVNNSTSNAPVKTGSTPSAESTTVFQPLGRYAAEPGKQRTRGIKIAAERDKSLHFAANSARLDLTKAKFALDDLYQKITAPDQKEHLCLIAGHADQRGSHELNDRLAQARAEAVRKILIERYGIPGNRLIARGYGKRYPLDPAENEAAWQANRRVELWDLTRTPEPYSRKEQ